MAKKKYYESSIEFTLGLKKLVEMDKEKATLIFDRIREDAPPHRLLSKGCRVKKYQDLPLSCLEYIWIGAKTATMMERLKAKSCYLVRVNEHNNPRKHMLFTLEENQQIIDGDEEVLIERLKNDIKNKDRN